MLKRFLVSAAALALTAGAAEARLQLTINVGASTFTCFDGQLSCDVSGGANNLLVIDQTVGGAFVQLTLAQSTFGPHNELQLSSSNIENTGGSPITVRLLASDTGFAGPVSFINNSGSLTFTWNVGAPDSALSFFADTLDAQGANPLNTPGALLESVSGHALTDPDSFAGSRVAAFDALGPFSMTEERELWCCARAAASRASTRRWKAAFPSPAPGRWFWLDLGFSACSACASARGTV